MPQDEQDVVARVRAALSTQGRVREVRMFGGLSFMLDGAMVVSVRGDGELLVRADPARADELLARDGARPAEMGPGREMGPSWVSVSADAVATEEALDGWLGVALEHHGRRSEARRGRPAAARGEASLDALPGIGAPATRALHQAGYTALRQLAGVAREDLAALHGVGPRALGTIEDALQQHGLRLG